ncbi:MAG TPA: hypothetical protein VGJ77_16170 [Gaiellaceae bacterium]|jgi:hypothetical protein
MKALRTLVLFEAATFVAAASIHFGALVDGYEHHRAGTAETVIAAVLVAGFALSFVRPREAVVGAQAFATLGVCVGLFTIAVGVGPRTAPDIAYHLAILALLITGLGVTSLRPPPSRDAEPELRRATRARRSG